MEAKGIRRVRVQSGRWTKAKGTDKIGVQGGCWATAKGTDKVRVQGRRWAEGHRQGQGSGQALGQRAQTRSGFRSGECAPLSRTCPAVAVGHCLWRPGRTAWLPRGQQPRPSSAPTTCVDPPARGEGPRSATRHMSNQIRPSGCYNRAGIGIRIRKKHE